MTGCGFFICHKILRKPLSIVKEYVVVSYRNVT